jgi:propanediol dehydratase small subunit
MDDGACLTDLYPIAERRPDLVRTLGGRELSDLSVDAVLEGKIGLDDIRVTPEALRLQASVARAAGREKLAENFERAAELVLMPQEELLATYELLRPGRAGDADVLRKAAGRLKTLYGAVRVAALIEEAARAYAERGLFERRF